MVSDNFDYNERLRRRMEKQANGMVKRVNFSSGVRQGQENTSRKQNNVSRIDMELRKMFPRVSMNGETLYATTPFTLTINNVSISDIYSADVMSDEVICFYTTSRTSVCVFRNSIRNMYPGNVRRL